MLLKYIKCEKQLHACMVLLGQKNALRVEVLPLFSAFVVNPSKEKKVEEMLRLNRDKILSHLEQFPEIEDEVLLEQYEGIVEALKKIPAPQKEEKENEAKEEGLKDRGSGGATAGAERAKPPDQSEGPAAKKSGEAGDETKRNESNGQIGGTPCTTPEDSSALPKL